MFTLSLSFNASHHSPTARRLWNTYEIDWKLERIQFIIVDFWISLAYFDREICNIRIQLALQLQLTGAPKWNVTACNFYFLSFFNDTSSSIVQRSASASFRYIFDCKIYYVHRRRRCSSLRCMARLSQNWACNTEQIALDGHTRVSRSALESWEYNFHAPSGFHPIS